MSHPFLAASFDIPWSQLTSEHVGADIELALGRANTAIDRIAAQGLQDLNFDNTFLALEAATEELQR
jgi:oligopeptidase A